MAPATIAATEVPADPTNPKYDVLSGEIGTRTHYIHIAMASVEAPMTVAEISKHAERLARQGGYPVKPTTFAPQTTRAHLVSMRDKPGRGFAEQVEDGRWRLTERARRRIANPDADEPTSDEPDAREPEIRTVDAKSRLLLPKEFANATVTIERVGENEIRIRKAVVVPVDEFPLIEDQLKPLSDRDRDLFLSLLENPPEPTAALRKALKLHKKRHG
ncbi:MAG TPA: hypothetical protein VM529_02105 [Gemmata sp.]|jgi:hypothetical protein|nr:hypothetical protein [Gemmata sp.]